jgi:hypothetical protein
MYSLFCRIGVVTRLTLDDLIDRHMDCIEKAIAVIEVEMKKYE